MVQIPRYCGCDYGQSCSSTLTSSLGISICHRFSPEKKEREREREREREKERKRKEARKDTLVQEKNNFPVGHSPRTSQAVSHLFF